MDPGDEVDAAIGRAIGYLEAQRSPDGLWRDFHTLAGTSSDWVSGFVAYAIASAAGRRPSVLTACKVLLARQRPNGGWSYNRTVPTDCDSSSWVLLALSAGPMWRPSAIRRGLRFIADHGVDGSGGFATYAAQDGIERFVELPASMTVGWRTAHACVTAVAVECLLVHGERRDSALVRAALEYLVGERDSRGVWPSYWWKGVGYGTYHALRALRMARAIGRRDVDDTLASLVARQRPDGGWCDHDIDADAAESEVFGTACIVLALLLEPSAATLPAAARAVDWLTRTQRPSGAWPATPILRIPTPLTRTPDEVSDWRIDAPGTGVIVADQRASFTTAAALWALGAFQRVAPSRGDVTRWLPDQRGRATVKASRS
jgi:squalene-hopene/tetraprenyl-beta-curcumene cyclase